MEDQVNCRPYSYHVFLFPFLWSGSARNIETETFKKCLVPGWEIDKAFSPALLRRGNGSDPESDMALVKAYTQYHYFDPAARNAIYNGAGKEAAVENLRYHGEGLTYTVNDYELTVSQIRLKLFSDGVGILVFELQNFASRSVAAVKKINDMGRRIFAPFLSYDPQKDRWGCSLCAQKLLLGINGAETGTVVKPPASAASTDLAQPILALLTSGGYTVTANEEEESSSCFFIEPIIDDRMFVACYLHDPAFSAQLKERVDGEYRYLHDAAEAFGENAGSCANVARDLYELIFMDGDGCTCQNKDMLRGLLEKSTYARWVEYDSISGISDYSLVTVSASDAAYLLDPFLTEYVEMAILALAQRASLLYFSSWVSDIILSDPGKRGAKSGLEALNRKYLKFKSQLLLKEVTPQQQGIELYQMFREKMFIDEQVASVESKIDSLFAQSQLVAERWENGLLFVLALMTVADVVNCAFDWFTKGACARGSVFLLLLLISLLLYRGKSKLKWF